MLDPRKIAELEQAAATLVELLKNIKDEAEKKFTKQQAWELTKTIAFAMFGGKGTAG